MVFHLHRAHPALLRQLDVTEAPIVARHLYAGSDPNQNPANLRPVGTGPFRFESYRRDDQVVLLRNPAYFKPGLPRLDKLVFRILPNASTQVNALLAGEVDMLQRVSALDAQRLKGQAMTLVDTRAAAGGAHCTMTLAFNLQRPRLDDLRVRRAIAQAIDREQVPVSYTHLDVYKRQARGALGPLITKPRHLLRGVGAPKARPGSLQRQQAGPPRVGGQALQRHDGCARPPMAGDDAAAPCLRQAHQPLSLIHI